MGIFQHPKIFRKLFYSWLVFVAVCAIIYMSVNQMVLFYYKNEKIVSRLEINDNKILKLKKEIEEKKTTYNFLITERGKEEYYREVYPVAKEGEKVIILYNSTDTGIDVLSTSTSFWTDTVKKFRFFIDNYTNL